VRLRPVAGLREITKPRVIGDFNKFDTDSAVPMTRAQDGRWVASIPFRGDSSRFQILGVGAGARHSWMRGVRAAVVHDSATTIEFGGVLRPERDSLHFSFDSTGVPRRDLPAVVMTASSDTALVRANAIRVELEDFVTTHRQFADAGYINKDSVIAGIRTRAGRYLDAAVDRRLRLSAAVSELYATVFIGRHRSDSLDRLASRAYFDTYSPSELPTSDGTTFSMFDNATWHLVSVTGSAADSAAARAEYVDRLLKRHLPFARNTRLPKRIRSFAYIDALFAAQMLNTSPALDSLIEEAIAFSPEDQRLPSLRLAFGSKRPLRVGTAFPAFRLETLYGIGAAHTNAIFTGKLTLLDFWGTWCAPCVQQLPFLEKVYAQFKDRGFQILSISSDPNVQTVADFRRTKFPMPWFHALVGSPDAPAVTALGVIAWPTLVLVDSTGTIITVNDGLRDEALQRTIERLLPK
jgi:thiol-disulfide isomerase/thioredoxin